MKNVQSISLLLFSIVILLMGARMFGGDLSMDWYSPDVMYRINLNMRVTPRSSDGSITVTMPTTHPDQELRNESIHSGSFRFRTRVEGENRLGEFRTEAATLGQPTTLQYEVEARVKKRSFRIPNTIRLPDSFPENVKPYLKSGKSIPSDHEEIRNQVRTLLSGKQPSDRKKLFKLYQFVHREIHSSEEQEKEGALETLRRKKGFCGGQSRLLVALYRAANIPARVVGGIILEPGTKKVTHNWVEVWLNGFWVSMDPLNGHYAEKPARFFRLYTGDLPLIRRSRNMDFAYLFHIDDVLVPPERIAEEKKGSSFLNAYHFWDLFRRVDISLDLLKILLVFPIGILVVIVFRNMVGLTPFGTFTPALLAVAFRDTGLFWGMILFVGVLSMGLILRFALERVQLMYTPRLAVILMFVLGYILAVSYFSVREGFMEPAHIGMFPIAILTVSVERQIRRIQEMGYLNAIKVTLHTLVIVLLCYMVMESRVIQSIVIVFPEVLLAVLACFLILGRWTGMRLLEFYRFRFLMVNP